MLDRYNDSLKDGEQLQREREAMLASQGGASSASNSAAGPLGYLIAIGFFAFLFYSMYSSGVAYFAGLIVNSFVPNNIQIYVAHGLTIASLLGIFASIYLLGRLLVTKFVSKTLSFVYIAIGVLCGFVLGFGIGHDFFTESPYRGYISIAGAIVFVFIGYKKPKWTIVLAIIGLVYMLFTREPLP